jgi:hypothetical protein
MSNTLQYPQEDCRHLLHPDTDLLLTQILSTSRCVKVRSQIEEVDVYTFRILPSSSPLTPLRLHNASLHPRKLILE